MRQAVYLSPFLICLLSTSAYTQLFTENAGNSQRELHRFQLEGVVKVQNKYSIVVSSLLGDIEVRLNPKTQVVMKIQRANFDLRQKKLIVDLPISAPDGDFLNNEKIEYPLSDELFIQASFPHKTAMKKAMAGPVKRLANYRLSSQIIADENSDVDESLQLKGRLLAGDKPKSIQLVADDQVFQVSLGNRDARWLGFSILDLVPYQTDVFISGVREGDEYFADEILFTPVGDPLKREKHDLPRCLFLGDTISFNYQRPLREALSGLVNLHHPPQNCRGSDNWKSIARWMGAYRDVDRDWDVITFNFGLWDADTTKENYQINLRNAIRVLRDSDAKLIWVTSTPIDYGFNSDGKEGEVIPVDQREQYTHESQQSSGLHVGRMRTQNEWAAEVLKDYPEIAICDLHQVVVNGKETVYKDWWYNKKPEFEYPQSVPLGRSLARHILEAIGESADKIQPMDVHSAQVEELDDEK